MSVLLKFTKEIEVKPINLYIFTLIYRSHSLTLFNFQCSIKSQTRSRVTLSSVIKGRPPTRKFTSHVDNQRRRSTHLKISNRFRDNAPMYFAFFLLTNLHTHTHTQIVFLHYYYTLRIYTDRCLENQFNNSYYINEYKSK